MIFKSLKALATAALFSAALPLAGQAADIAPVPDTSDWSFTAAAYVWGAGLSGDVGVFGLPPQDVDLPFSDIIGSLDFAFMGLAEARKDRFMLGVDLTYTNVGKTVETPFGILANKIDITNTSLMLTGLAGYALYDTDVARLDVVGGGRYYNVNNEFDVRGGFLGGKSKDDGANWVDPLAGAKLRVDLLPNVYVASWAMIGGFGVGSDLAWQAMVSVQWKASDKLEVIGGYRYLDVDYENGSGASLFKYDVVTSGPGLGFSFRF